jgi:hypothetical protein
VTCFAVVLASRPSPAGILLMVPERGDAEEIAMELRRKGHSVSVQAVSDERSRVELPAGRPPRPARPGQ